MHTPSESGLPGGLHLLEHGDAHDGRGLHHPHARALESLDLILRRALAARDDRAGVAHAAAGRRREPGDEGHNGLVSPARLDELRPVLLRGAADLPDHDDALRLGVGHELLEAVHEVGAVERVAADAHHGRLAQARRRGLVHRLVRERTGARHHADLAWGVNVAGHDPDLALARLDDARAVGANEARLGLAHHGRLDLDHVVLGDPLRDANDQLDLVLKGLQDRGGREGRGHVDHRRIAVRALLGLSHRVEHGEAEVSGATLLWGHATDHVGAIGNRLLRVEGAVLAGKPLADDLSMLVHEHIRFGAGRVRPLRVGGATAGEPGKGTEHGHG
mmetsp:Transcript_63472/g.200752  ORF Transcript_63472/g.200752 Transcript_63472/m.200752 type:complete len:332 (-) Transcript_63472:58-1053(-)